MKPFLTFCCFVFAALLLIPPTTLAETTKPTDDASTTTPQGPPPKFTITDFRKQCVKDLSFEPVAAGDFGNVSFGPTIAAKVLTYDLASKKAGFNTGIGAGFSMRLYSDVKLRKSADGTREEKHYGISGIRKECRGETFDGAWLDPDNQKVIPWMSITPIVYASKAERTDEIAIQPAISVGFLGELVNVGAGFNLSGPDKGHVFLLLSLGYGFKF